MPGILLGDDLRRDVDAAETVHDWSNAEQTLRKLVALDGSDTSSRQRLATLQREHGPDRAGSRSRPLVSRARRQRGRINSATALHVIWPVWNPDRSQIAFLAPDPDDPMGNVSLYVVGWTVAPRSSLPTAYRRTRRRPGVRTERASPTPASPAMTPSTKQDRSVFVLSTWPPARKPI